MSEEHKIWYSIEIETAAEAEEAVAFALNELGALGTEINSLGKKPDKNITITGYFNEKPDDEALQNQLAEALRIYGFSKGSFKTAEWREVENRDWLAEWKKHWKPTETEKFIIAPVWAKIKNTEKIIIRIEPSMAFGTGTHETTRLCLRAIEENFTPGETFLDVGTGTGILAIAAARIQIPDSRLQIAGCDTDADSIKIAKENSEINGVAGKISFYTGSISEQTPPFDFVCANLTADVIVPLLPLLKAKSKRILVLSGILKEQENSIIAELKKIQVSNFKIETEGEWISVLVSS